MQQTPQGAKSIFWVIHKEMAQLCGRERKGSVDAKVPHCPPGPCQRPHIKSHLPGEVQSGSRLARSKLPAQAAAVQDILRSRRGDPATYGEKAEASWHHTSTGTPPSTAGQRQR